MKFEIFIGRNYLYYFRYVASNGQIICTSGDGYSSRANCLHAINLLKQFANVSPVYEK